MSGGFAASTQLPDESPLPCGDFAELETPRAGLNSAVHSDAIETSDLGGSPAALLVKGITGDATRVGPGGDSAYVEDVGGDTTG